MPLWLTLHHKQARLHQMFGEQDICSLVAASENWPGMNFKRFFQSGVCNSNFFDS